MLIQMTADVIQQLVVCEGGPAPSAWTIQRSFKVVTKKKQEIFHGQRKELLIVHQ